MFKADERFLQDVFTGTATLTFIIAAFGLVY